MSAFEKSSRITPFLWFDANAEEAVAFYLKIFKNSRKTGEMRDIRSPSGTVFTISFELEGLQFTALNGGPGHRFTEGISFVIRCYDQAEVDYYWEKLSAGSSDKGQCGWIKDKFGLSWQVVPAQLPDLIKHPKAMQAMLGMKKLNIAELKRAANAKE